MLCNYKEAVGIFGSDYKLQKAIRDKDFFKIESGIYSDKIDNFTLEELILKKYNKAFLVKDSALYLLGFIQRKPNVVHIGTSRNALRIKDVRVKQHFYSDFYEDKICGRFGFNLTHILSSNNIKSHTTKFMNEIRLFDLGALLLDLIRDNKSYPKHEFLDLLIKFRDCPYLVNLSSFDLEENLFHYNLMYLYCNREIRMLIEEICAQTFARKLWNDFDFD